MGMAILLGLLFSATTLAVVWSLWWRLNSQLTASNHAEAGLWVAFLSTVALALAVGLAVLGLMASLLVFEYGSIPPAVGVPTALTIAGALVVTAVCALSRAWRKFALMLALEATAAAVIVALFVFLVALSFQSMEGI